MESEETPLLSHRPPSADNTRNRQTYTDADVGSLGLFDWRSAPAEATKMRLGAHRNDVGHRVVVEAKIAPWDDKVTAREQLAFQLDRSILGSLWDLVDAILNFAWVVLYIFMTAFADRLPSYWFHVDVILGAVIFLQYLLHCVLSVEPILSLTDHLGVTTFLSYAPVVMAAFTHSQNDGTYLDAGVWIFAYFFRFIRLRIIAIRAFSPNHNLLLFLQFEELTRRLISTFITVVTTLLAVTSFVHIIEYKYQGLREDVSFADVFYFILISSTSGLSTKIVPDSWFSRMVIIGLMVVGATYLPPAIAELISIIRKRSVYDKPFKESAGFKGNLEQSRSHVVFCGPFNLDSLRVTLKEFFSEDHGAGTALTKIVLLDTTEPDEALSDLLESNLYARRVQFVKGTPVSFRDLTRAGVRTAKACFILHGAKFSGKGNDDEDANIIMRALAIKRFDNHMPVYVQIALPSNKIHAEAVAEHTFCKQEIKYGLLAANALAPGYATLLHLLVTSVTSDVIQSFDEDSQRDPVSFGWMREYARGACHEIYVIRLCSIYAGYTFSFATEVIFRMFGTILFGLGVEGADGTVQVFLNPYDYVLKGGETAYLIATEWPLAVRVAQGFGIPVKRASAEFVEGGVISHSADEEAGIFHAFDEQDLVEEGITDDEMDAEEYMLLSRAQREKLFAERKRLKAERKRKQAQAMSKMDKSGSFTGIPVVKDGLIEPRDALAADLAVAPTVDQVGGIVVEGDAPVSLSKISKTGASVSFVTLGQATDKTDLASDSIEQEDTDGLPSIAEEKGVEPSRPSLLKKGGVARSATTASETLDRYKLGDELPKAVRDHVIIADYSGEFPSDLEYFVGPFRERETKLGKRSTPIVFLCGKPPARDAWESLMPFGNVYHVLGSPLSRTDLLKCNLNTCKRFVVLDDPAMPPADRTSDSKTLLSILNVEALDTNKDIFIQGCFLHNENLKLIGDTNITASVERYGQIVSPSFVSGHVFLGTMLDAWIVQTYYDRHMDKVMRALIFGSDYVLTGRAPTSEDDVGDQSLLTQSKGYESMFDDTVHDRFWHHATSDSDIQAPDKLSKVSSFVYRVAVPERYIGKTFGQVYADLTRRYNAIPIALYCKVFVPRDNSENEMSPIRYSILNPRRQRKIREDDRVFVLSNGKPDWV